MLNATQNQTTTRDRNHTDARSRPTSLSEFARNFFREHTPGERLGPHSRARVLALIDVLWTIDTEGRRRFPGAGPARAARDAGYPDGVRSLKDVPHYGYVDHLIVTFLDRYVPSAYKDEWCMVHTLFTDVLELGLMETVRRWERNRRLNRRELAALTNAELLGKVGVNYTSARAAHSELQRELRVADLDETCPEACPEPVSL